MAEKAVFDSTNLKQKLMRLIEFEVSDRVRAALGRFFYVRKPIFPIIARPEDLTFLCFIIQVPVAFSYV